MQYVDSKDILDITLISESGHFSCVFKSSYNDEYFAHKILYFPKKFFNGNCNLEYKINVLKTLRLAYSLIPKFITQTCDELDGYLTDLGQYCDICSISNLTLRYRALMDIKCAILELHRKGIVHGDIHSHNMVRKDDRMYLIDFDNCSGEDYGIFFDNRNALVCADEFVDRNGVSEYLDIFLFNILTYKALSGEKLDILESDPVGIEQIRKAIIQKRYGLFTRKDSKDICDCIMHYKPSEFLIDTIDEKDVKRYSIMKK